MSSKASKADWPFKVLGVMKLTTVLAVLISAAAFYARHSKTNAEHFARCLPPLPPARHGTPVAGKFHPWFHLTVALIIYSDRYNVCSRAKDLSNAVRQLFLSSS